MANFSSTVNEILAELIDDPLKTTQNERSALMANLNLLWVNANHEHPNFDSLWTQLIEHLKYPDYNPYPSTLFRLPQKDVFHYQLAIKHLDAIYQKYGE